MEIKIKVEVQKRKSKLRLDLEDLGFSEAKNRLDDFLSYVYRSDEDYEEKGYRSKFTPEYVPGWIGEQDIENLSYKDKVFLLLEKNHANDWVKSQDLQREYEDVYGESIKLSSVSTYLARFFDQGALERRGSRAQRMYKLSKESAVAKE